MKTRPLKIALVFAAGFLLNQAKPSNSISGGDAEFRPVWNETKWPFLLDAWPQGRAFHCSASACGAEIDVYVRQKLGFCNCYTGVTDDDEIDRVGDLVLLGGQYVPLASGQPVTLSGWPGRARQFLVEFADRSKRHAIGIALSKKCDALVATVVGHRAISDSAEGAAMNLLNSERIKDWMETLPSS
jgi:hypothetical protein